MDHQDDLEEGADEALWKLLGKARTPEASPYFTRRVQRAIDEYEADAAFTLWRRFWVLWTGWLRTPILGGGALAAMAALLLALPVGQRTAVLPVPGSHMDATLPDASPETLNEQDVKVIADLDDLLDSQESHVWLDDDTTS